MSLALVIPRQIKKIIRIAQNQDIGDSLIIKKQHKYQGMNMAAMVMNPKYL
jgi:hypothetical protein